MNSYQQTLLNIFKYSTYLRCLLGFGIARGITYHLPDDDHIPAFMAAPPRPPAAAGGVDVAAAAGSSSVAAGGGDEGTHCYIIPLRHRLKFYYCYY